MTSKKVTIIIEATVENTEDIQFLKQYLLSGIEYWSNRGGISDLAGDLEINYLKVLQDGRMVQQESYRICVGGK